LRRDRASEGAGYERKDLPERRILQAKRELPEKNQNTVKRREAVNDTVQKNTAEATITHTEVPTVEHIRHQKLMISADQVIIQAENIKEPLNLLNHSKKNQKKKVNKHFI
ncbi:MAG: hypothetical protein ABI462_14400, partial [Ignavibacteria bacterium]